MWWGLQIPCCLVWDGVKLELELELELAGLGCSDFREEEKSIVNASVGYYTLRRKRPVFKAASTASLGLCKENEPYISLGEKTSTAEL